MSSDWKKNNLKLQRFERKVCPKRCRRVAGVDEAGRGPLAGPVVACAVIPQQHSFTTRIFDSKKLSKLARQRAFEQIVEKAHLGIGIVFRETIDQRNILQATIIAIKRALRNLDKQPDYLLIDGKFSHRQLCLSSPYQTIVQGDARCFSIACASIVAKVIRDNLMSHYSTLYPQYGFNRNRGYFTPEHIRAIKKHGLSPLHRLSFHPCTQLGDNSA